MDKHYKIAQDIINYITSIPKERAEFLYYLLKIAGSDLFTDEEFSRFIAMLSQSSTSINVY